jgi:hypothetical protein
LTGKAAIPASNSEKARLPQNRTLSSSAFIAPGISSMSALSTISMIVMDAVSEAKASLRTTGVVSPEASSGRTVRP